MRFMAASLLLAGGVCASLAFAADDVLKPFPAAKPEQNRFVIQLPKKANESNWRVELLPGKPMQIDCNQHSLSGKLNSKNLEGWGYSYYEFSSDGQVVSTMMACPDAKKRNAFVQAEGLMLPYNSRLPVVVYADKAYGLQYRVWQAGRAQPATRN